jgi:hypothetical protein
VIVFRSVSYPVVPVTWLARLQAEAARLARGSPAHDDVRTLLIELGALEAAVADARCPDADAPAAAAGLETATRSAARALRLSWDRGGRAALRAALDEVCSRLAAVRAERLPRSAREGVAEGYAYYALYPEAYIEAGRHLARRRRPPRAVCVGIRSIGTSLAAAAAAGLEAEGTFVDSYTVRPRGHPFARHLRPTPALRKAWCDRRDALFVIADEGPGLSGSSFASVAGALEALGVAAERIVLLPSWLPDAAQLRSDAGRSHWGRHERLVISFETLWLDSGRLAGSLGTSPARLTDLSAGRWRALWIDDVRAYPAVHPQHERRKYLYVEERRCYLAKFAGLGPYGRAALERAHALADAGIGLRPVGASHGFLVWPVVKARPLRARAIDEILLDRLAAYVTELARRFPVSAPCPWDELLHLVETNVREGLGGREFGSDGLARLAERAPACRSAPMIALDGRMLPHEWLRYGHELIKTDATDHHEDHFFPGHQDIAWDIAATCAEFALPPAAEAALLERYRRWSGDRDIAVRLPCYRVAYLAFRLGYARLAGDTLARTPDGARWRRAARRYATLLRRAIAMLPYGS